MLQDSSWVSPSDGRVVAVPLAWFPRLLNASQQQRELFRISTRGLHWEALNEDISVAGLLAGLPDRTNRPVQPPATSAAWPQTVRQTRRQMALRESKTEDSAREYFGTGHNS